MYFIVFLYSNPNTEDLTFKLTSGVKGVFPVLQALLSFQLSSCLGDARTSAEEAGSLLSALANAVVGAAEGV